MEYFFLVIWGEITYEITELGALVWRKRPQRPSSDGEQIDQAGARPRGGGYTVLL
jgi:hypothetical protein